MEDKVMKEFFAKTYRFLVIIGIILSFILSFSVIPFSQAKTFQKISKSANPFNTLKSQVYATEYNLTSYINSGEDFRFSESEDNRDYLNFLSFKIPYFNPLQEYFKNGNFTYNLLSYLDYKLHSIPPPCCS